jgi:hypothetical protein
MTRIGVRALAVVVGGQLLTACVLAAGSSSGSGGSSSSSSSSVFFLFLPMALVLLMAGLARRRLRPSRRHAGSLNERHRTTNEQVLRAELSVLADDVIRFEPGVALNERHAMTTKQRRTATGSPRPPSTTPRNLSI